MLTKIRDFLQARQMAPLSDIALHLGVTPEVVRPMVERWVRKGQVERLDGARACSGCDRCGDGALEVYRWCGPGDIGTKSTDLSRRH